MAATTAPSPDFDGARGVSVAERSEQPAMLLVGDDPMLPGTLTCSPRREGSTPCACSAHPST
jgi:hypothetical protein